MKSFKRLFVLVFALVLVIPFSVFAEEEETATSFVDTSIASEYYSSYNTLNFLEALDEEEIEYEFEDYSENDNQAVIYLFRGKGCTYCRAFLSYLNSIAAEYGEYFRVVSFEVWNDSANSELLSEVSDFLGEAASGVPYIVIGDQVFPGYSSTYDDQIIAAITDLYNTNTEDRYDVFVKMNDKKDHSAVVGVVTVLVFGGLIAAAVYTRKNNG